jgi:hypothetical protein
MHAVPRPLTTKPLFSNIYSYDHTPYCGAGLAKRAGTEELREVELDALSVGLFRLRNLSIHTFIASDCRPRPRLAVCCAGLTNTGPESCACARQVERDSVSSHDTRKKRLLTSAQTKPRFRRRRRVVRASWCSVGGGTCCARFPNGTITCMECRHAWTPVIG